MFRIPLWWEAPIWRAFQVMEYRSVEELKSDLGRLAGLSLLQNHSRFASSDHQIHHEIALPSPLSELLLEEWMQGGLLYCFVFVPEQPIRLNEGTPERKLADEKLKSMIAILTQAGYVGFYYSFHFYLLFVCTFCYFYVPTFIFPNAFLFFYFSIFLFQNQCR
jgi:hypothetical protein